VAASKLLLDHYARVQDARVAGDVYTPLKAEIDEVRERFDYPLRYLDAELVRTLAAGQPERMRR